MSSDVDICLEIATSVQTQYLGSNHFGSAAAKRHEKWGKSFEEDFEALSRARKNCPSAEKGKKNIQIVKKVKQAKIGGFLIYFITTTEAWEPTAVRYKEFMVCEIF